MERKELLRTCPEVQNRLARLVTVHWAEIAALFRLGRAKSTILFRASLGSELPAEIREALRADVRIPAQTIAQWAESGQLLPEEAEELQAASQALDEARAAKLALPAQVRMPIAYAGVDGNGSRRLLASAFPGVSWTGSFRPCACYWQEFQVEDLEQGTFLYRAVDCPDTMVQGQSVNFRVTVEDIPQPVWSYVLNGQA